MARIYCHLLSPTFAQTPTRVVFDSEAQRLEKGGRPRLPLLATDSDG